MPSVHVRDCEGKGNVFCLKSEKITFWKHGSTKIEQTVILWKHGSTKIEQKVIFWTYAIWF